MSNETFLTVTYVFSGLSCVCLGIATSLWLRRPVNGIASALPQEPWRIVLKRAFPLSTICLAFSAFLSVRYVNSCNPRPYQKIVEDRDYIMAINRSQVSTTLDWIVIGVGIWGGVILLCLLAIRRGRAGKYS